MRRKDETLKEILLDCAREILNASGVEAINIRAIAKKAGVATGTVYNYFSNKEDILLALTEEYWSNTLSEMHKEITSTTFIEQLRESYHFLRTKILNSGGELMASLQNVETTGRERMQDMQKILHMKLNELMEKDNTILKDIWDETFTKEKYIDFIIINIMWALQTRAEDIEFFLEVMKRTIYNNENRIVVEI